MIRIRAGAAAAAVPRHRRHLEAANLQIGQRRSSV